MNRPTTLRALRIAFTALCGLVAVLLCVLWVRHLSSQHYRPIGHQGIRIAISSTDDELVFNAAGEGGRDLYLFDLADRQVVQIAATPNYEVDPSFSRDGSRIVYAAGVPGDPADHIFTIKRNGSARTQLTYARANDSRPQFSPDGKQIVFVRDKNYTWGGLAANWSGGGSVWIISDDGTGERQLTADDMYANRASFSPDGDTVCIFSIDGLISVPIEGSESPVWIRPPLWDASISSDGTKIVSSEGEFARDLELFVSSLNGKNKTRITSSKGGCTHPVLTAKGDRVLFLKEEWLQGPTGVPKSGIWSVKIDGSNQEQLADTSLFDDPSQWKPQ